jgi:hypothetical protein
MKDSYSIQNFYLLLKLGIFKSGKIADWGHISLDDSRHCLLKKSVAEYETRPLIKKQLDVGLYLLDLYLLEKNDHRNTHIMVVSVYRAATAQTKVYVLKLITIHKVEEIRTAIKESTTMPQKRTLYSITPKRLFADGGRMGKISQKHYINDGAPLGKIY